MNEKTEEYASGMWGTESMAYVAILPCGCVDIICSDCEECSNDIAKMFKERNRRRYTIKHLPSHEVRNMEWTCKQHQQEKQISLLERKK